MHRFIFASYPIIFYVLVGYKKLVATNLFLFVSLVISFFLSLSLYWNGMLQLKHQLWLICYKPCNTLFEKMIKKYMEGFMYIIGVKFCLSLI